MQKNQKLVAGLLTAGLLLGNAAFAAENDWDLTANLGLTSNYMWRGTTLSGDQAAIQGGVDWQFNNGFYLGSWISNVSGGYEQDWYGGFGFRTDEVIWDVGYVLYTYPVHDNATFGEVYANLSWRMLNGGVALTLNADDDPANPADSGDVFLYIGASWKVSGLDLGGTFGNYSRGRDNFDNYSYLELFAEKDKLRFSFAKNSLSGKEGDYRFWLAYTMDFNLM